MRHPLRSIDAFCGAGGSTTGAEQAGFTSVAAINHWEVAALSYEVNHGIRPLRDSLAQVNPADLPACDAMLFSPECQSHARARGARPRDEMSRNTAMEVVRFVAVCKPRLFVVENVPEIRSWPRFYEWCNELSDLGYHLNRTDLATPGQMLDSAAFGVPQTRVRWFLVGSTERQVQIDVPKLAVRTLRECIDWRYPMRRNLLTDPISEHYMAQVRDGWERGLSEYVVVYYGSQRGATSLDKPCRTVVTKDRFGLVRGHWYRMLQPSELLRVMGFPDSYVLCGTRSQQVAQCGNAVAPPVMKSILEQAA